LTTCASGIFAPFDTIGQIQALRPYYTFLSSDIDRYTINGQYRQVLLSPRELDIRQLPDARTRWINPHFIYTHGYGMVLAEVSKITADGLPLLLIQNAPPEVKTPSLKLTRPEIYYGKSLMSRFSCIPRRREFNYPSGGDNVQTPTRGKGASRSPRCPCASPPRSARPIPISCSPITSRRKAA
jgi:uncharacterized membrane protein (UPF0182 family)